MSSKSLLGCLVLLSALSAAGPSSAEDRPVIKIASQHGQPSLTVDGRPYLILGGELHNSSASSVSYMHGIWDQLGPTAVNTVLANVSWQQFEPTEGQYDYSILDALIENARLHQKHLVILWFGSWKNGASSYAPLWVLGNQRRFPRVLTASGAHLETLSVVDSRSTFEAEKAAYTALLSRIKEKDPDGRVLMMQVNNEVGILGQGYDNSPAAKDFLQKPVPKILMSYIRNNVSTLRPELLDTWTKAGRLSSGNWTTVFGDTPSAREFALAWSYASYQNGLSAAGKEMLDIPTFVNAWIVQDSKQLPGDYPAGGSVSRVMDIYKAAAPSIDLMAPDIYLPDFKGIVADYRRNDNPLFVPESTPDPGRAFYAIGQEQSIGFSPFGIDEFDKIGPLNASYAVLQSLAPLLMEGRQKGYETFGVLRQSGETETSIDLPDMTITVKYSNDNGAAYGIIIRDSENHFYIAGQNLFVQFRSKVKGKASRIAVVFEGNFKDGVWQNGRLLNGDETFHNDAVRVEPRKSDDVFAAQLNANLAPQPTLEGAVNQPHEASVSGAYDIPQVYSVSLYWRGE